MDTGYPLLINLGYIARGLTQLCMSTKFGGPRSSYSEEMNPSIFSIVPVAMVTGYPLLTKLDLHVGGLTHLYMSTKFGGPRPSHLGEMIPSIF